MRLTPVAAEHFGPHVGLWHAHPLKDVIDSRDHAGLAAEVVQRVVQPLACHEEKGWADPAPQSGPALLGLFTGNGVECYESRIQPLQLFEFCPVRNLVLSAIAEQ